MLWIKRCDNNKCYDTRKGLRIKSSKESSVEVRNEVKAYAKWLRQQYCFPIRVPVYLYSKNKLKTNDGDTARAVFFEPFDHITEPYIKIATGIHNKNDMIKNERIIDILFDLTHELTHYYQWLERSQKTIRGRERQANNYARKILWEYTMGRYPAFYSQIINSIPGCENAYCLIKPITEDNYGRIMFESRIITDTYNEDDMSVTAICQNVTNDRAYYYPHSYIVFSKANQIQQSAIDQLKIENCWNKEPSNSNLMFSFF